MSKKTGMADWFIKQIQRLAKIEKAITTNELTSEQAHTYRNEHAPDVINKIKAKLDELQDKTAPQGLLGKAINYTLSQWPKLLKYLKDGRLDISNNKMERAIKPFAVGRKNWLFANSTNGAHAAANIFSLIETCKAHQVDPYDWLRNTLTKIPACETLEQYEKLMPFNFKNIAADK
ncbi:MAG: transposase [Gammaproteobacteria bacterium]|nr:transposase [Gammaproteobacteria bacterium]